MFVDSSENGMSSIITSLEIKDLYKSRNVVMDIGKRILKWLEYVIWTEQTRVDKAEGITKMGNHRLKEPQDEQEWSVRSENEETKAKSKQ
jgi:hypothetical protein